MTTPHPGSPDEPYGSRPVPLARLLKRADFVAAAKGRRFHTEHMSVQGLRREANPERGLRLGLTLTRKVGHATERNRIRRRLRTASAMAAAPFASVPVDVVVIGRRPALSAPYPVLIEDLSRALAAVTRTPSGPDRRRGKPGPAAGSPSCTLRGDHA